MEPPITHITKVEIEKLWGLDDWNLTWELNPDVNILAGDNGSGKSTVLSLVCARLKNDANLIKKKSLQSETKIDVYFDNNRYYSIFYIPYTEAEHYKSNNPNLMSQKVRERLGIDIVYDYAGHLGEKESLVLYPHLNFIENTSYISNIDQKLKPLEAIQKLGGTGVETDLDWELYQLQDKYKDYQIRIGKRAIKALQGGSNDINEINSKLNLFWDLVDGLFGNTEKHIEREKENLSFLFRQDKVLTAYDLSAGEKQMLLILLTALVQDNKPAIMIMDEPEVSLHTDWQKDLIDNIRKLNENVQLIIATHSPAMIMKGWASPKYVFQIEDLKTKPQHEPIGASQQ